LKALRALAKATRSVGFAIYRLNPNSMRGIPTVNTGVGINSTVIVLVPFLFPFYAFFFFFFFFFRGSKLIVPVIVAGILPVLSGCLLISTLYYNQNLRKNPNYLWIYE
jgi:hypothetical protein